MNFLEILEKNLKPLLPNMVVHLADASALVFLDGEAIFISIATPSKLRKILCVIHNNDTHIILCFPSLGSINEPAWIYVEYANPDAFSIEKIVDIINEKHQELATKTQENRRYGYNICTQTSI